VRKQYVMNITFVNWFFEFFEIFRRFFVISLKWHRLRFILYSGFCL